MDSLRVKVKDYTECFASQDGEEDLKEDSEVEEGSEPDLDNDPENNVPIICTVNQLKSIIRLTIDDDKISRDMQRTKEQEQKFRSQISELTNALKGMKSNCFSTFGKVKEDISKAADILHRTQKNLEESKEDLLKNINSNADKISKLNAHAKEMEDFKKDVQNKIGGIVNKLKEQRQEYFKNDQEVESRMYDKLVAFKNDTAQRFDNVAKDIDKMKSYVTQMCDMTKVAATEMVENEIGRVSEIFEKVKDDMVTKTDNILMKNKKSISNIKNTCATFFDKYDQALQFMQRR